MRASLGYLLAILGAIATPGCSGPAPSEKPAAPAKGRVDPLIATIVAEPLMSDQQLSYQSNRDAVRPPDVPLSTPIPAIDVVPADRPAPAPPLPRPEGACDACRVAVGAFTLGALAERLHDPPARACAPAIGYSAVWATRLSDDLPLPASARVIEAAGSDGPNCRLRAVTYAAAIPLATFLASERARIRQAGYAVTYAASGALHALTARRTRDGSMLTLIASDAGGGITDIRVVMAGRR